MTPLGPFQNKAIAVTGACGAVGSELCRQLLTYRPFSFLMIDQRPDPLWDISHASMTGNCETLVLPCLEDVTDSVAIQRLFVEHQPIAVFHAAAYNIVSLMEQNPLAAVKNNVFGTKTVADAATSSGVKFFVLISTQGAGDPADIVDMTKRLAELYLWASCRRQGIGAVSFRLHHSLCEGHGTWAPPDAVALLLRGIAMGTGNEMAVLGPAGPASTGGLGMVEAPSGSRYVFQPAERSVPDLDDLNRRLAILRDLIVRGDVSRLRRLLAQLTSS